MDLERKFKDKVYNLVKEEYAVIGRYINSNTRIRMKHNTCSYEWDVYPGNFLNKNSRCPKCAGNAKLTHSEFLDKLTEIHAGEIKANTAYVGYTKKVNVIHRCGYTWDTLPLNLLQGKGCPKCSGSMKLTQQEIDKRMEDTFKGEYIFTEPYINSDTAINCLHSCGNEWKIRPYNLFSGRRCPSCYRRSSGELLVQSILEENNISFITEKTFEGCFDKGSLRFDFFIPQYNCVIEYDGEHHFLDNRYSTNADSLLEVQRRDSIKNEFCKDNDIHMIRLPYYLTNEEINKIVTKKLLGGSKAESLTPKC